MKNQTLHLGIPHTDALPLSHRDSMVSEAHYKLHVWHASPILLGSVMSIVPCLLTIGMLVSFELGKEVEENVFGLVTSVWDKGKRKILCPHEDLNFRPLSSAVWMLYHWAIETLVSKAHNEVHVCNQNFSLSHACDKTKKSIFLHVVTKLKLTIFLILSQNMQEKFSTLFWVNFRTHSLSIYAIWDRVVTVNCKFKQKGILLTLTLIGF